ncbi:MAG: YbhB/YbcL family Raf kinase inhibitor-like protein [Bacteroidia bacterium]
MKPDLQITEDIKTLAITSTAFSDGEYIPEKYTCDGRNVNPPLSIDKLPYETQSLVLIVEDPDAVVRTWTHWLVWNIPSTTKIKEDSVPGIEGVTDFGFQHYHGPCPPSGIHHYHFKVYALDTILETPAGSEKHEVEKQMAKHIIAFGELIGLAKHPHIV